MQEKFGSIHLLLEFLFLMHEVIRMKQFIGMYQILSYATIR